MPSKVSRAIVDRLRVQHTTHLTSSLHTNGAPMARRNAGDIYRRTAFRGTDEAPRDKFALKMYIGKRATELCILVLVITLGSIA